MDDIPILHRVIQVSLMPIDLNKTDFRMWDADDLDDVFESRLLVKRRLNRIFVAVIRQKIIQFSVDGQGYLSHINRGGRLF